MKHALAFICAWPFISYDRLLFLRSPSLTHHYTASAYRFWFRRGVGAQPPAILTPATPLQNL
ncbi:MAG: hypothetical protein HC780_12735 [Leptolyngbyaceae cyanobacterium CSU_1_3]|nr:hypothetical protein [Leptolyngbyaceae cyanobacterium CSU_1_3]